MSGKICVDEGMSHASSSCLLSGIYRNNIRWVIVPLVKLLLASAGKEFKKLLIILWFFILQCDRNIVQDNGGNYDWQCVAQL